MILGWAGFCVLLGFGWCAGACCGARSAACGVSSAGGAVGGSCRGASDTWVILKQVRLTLG